MLDTVATLWEREVLDVDVTYRRSFYTYGKWREVSIAVLFETCSGPVRTCRIKSDIIFKKKKAVPCDDYCAVCPQAPVGKNKKTLVRYN